MRPNVTGAGRRPLTILHLHNSRIVGGVEVSLIGWLRHLNAERCVARLFCFAEADGTERSLLAYIGQRDMSAHVLPWGWRKRLIAAVSELVRAIRANMPCIVHTHDMRPDIVGGLAARTAGVPWVASVHAWHSTWPDLAAKRRLIEAIRGRLLPYCDAVVAVSDLTREETIRRGVPAGRVMTVHTGTSLEDREPAIGRDAIRASLGFAADDIVIGNIARLHPEKGQALLIRAFERVSRSIPRARLLIVGDGTLREALRAQASRLGLTGRVTFEPFRDDLASLLGALDVFALPSHAEGIPLVVYQAMAAALPIVASDVGGISELLTHENNALLVSAGSVDAVADALIRVAADSQIRGALGKAARETVYGDARWSMATSTRRLEELYEQTWSRHDAAVAR